MFSNHSCLLLHLITLLTWRNNFRASANCVIDTITPSRNGDSVSLQCNVDSLPPNKDLFFCRNTTSIRNVTYLNQKMVEFNFIINKLTEGEYKCCCGNCQGVCSSQTFTILGEFNHNNYITCIIYIYIYILYIIIYIYIYIYE